MAVPMRIRLAEQHVVGAGFARAHRIVAGDQAADAGDAVGFQRRQRLLHGLDSGQMRAVGAGAGDQFGMAVDQQRRAAILNRRRQGLDARDHAARGRWASAAAAPPRYPRRRATPAGLRSAARDRPRPASRDRVAAAGVAGRVLP